MWLRGENIKSEAETNEIGRWKEREKDSQRDRNLIKMAKVTWDAVRPENREYLPYFCRIILDLSKMSKFERK